MRGNIMTKYNTTLKQFVSANVNAHKAQINLLDANRGICATWMRAMPVGTTKGKLNEMVKEHAFLELAKAVKMAGEGFNEPEFNCQKRKTGEGYQSINHSLGWFINPKGEIKMSAQLENNLNCAIRRAKESGLEAWCAEPDFTANAKKKAEKSTAKAFKTGGKEKDKLVTATMEKFITVAQGQKLAECKAMAKELSEVLAKYEAA
jgi:hypothetical protein